jgi:hypothetical protein
MSTDANAPAPNPQTPSTVSAPPSAPVQPDPCKDWQPWYLRLRDLLSFDTIESELWRIARYPLAAIQIVFYLLIAWGVVGSGLGAGDLFWHENPGHQVTVGLAVCWLFGPVLVVTILLLPPRNLPGLDDGKRSSFWLCGRHSLFFTRNPGLWQIGRRALLWLYWLGALVYGGKWAAVLWTSRPYWSGQVDGTSPFAVFVYSQWAGVPFVLGYLAAIALGAYATYVADDSRAGMAGSPWLLSTFNNPNVRVPSSAPGGQSQLTPVELFPGDVALQQLTALGTIPPGAAGAPHVVPNPTLTQAAYNLWSLLQLHALAYGFGLRILKVFALAGAAQLLIDGVAIPSVNYFSGQQYSGFQLLSPVAWVSVLLLLLNVFGGFVAFRFRYTRVGVICWIAYLFVANVEAGAVVPVLFLIVGAVAVLARAPLAWLVGWVALVFVTVRGAVLGVTGALHHYPFDSPPVADDSALRLFEIVSLVVGFVLLVAYTTYVPVVEELQWARARWRTGDGSRPPYATPWVARAFGCSALVCFLLGNNFGCQTHPMRYDVIDYDRSVALERHGEPSDGKGLIRADELLSAFEATNRSEDGRKPRLVLVAVSGGGIRASVWTGVVLEGLERELSAVSFRDRVRIITGASGGMVGASAYAFGSRNPKDDWGPYEYVKPHVQCHQTGLRPLAWALARDALSPVAQTMIVRDFTWNALFPNRYDVDRGRTLESAWRTNFTGRLNWEERYFGHFPCFVNRSAGSADGARLFKASPFDRPMRDLLDYERACAKPSLLFAPVLVEDTKRLFVSNLDLQFLTAPTALRLDGTAHGVLGRLRHALSLPEPLARPGVEFFRLFPDATKFKVGSAARMSASFPVVSPAVPIPTEPVRRVVDAGYYDNYGLDILTNWLLHNEQLIERHTSGVLIVQIRAFPLEDKGTAFQPESGGLLDKLIGAVSAPLDAVLNARGWSAYHRNNQQLAEVARVFKRLDKGGRPFFATTVFELQQEAALSWYLTSAQKRQVAEGFYKYEKGKFVLHADQEKRPGEFAVTDKVNGQIEAIREWFQKP